MEVFAYTLVVLLIITSVLLTLLILLHRGKGGGLSSMFGGGVSTSLAGSSVAEKNLDRYTLVVGIIWFACIVGFGLWIKVTPNPTTASGFAFRQVVLDSGPVCDTGRPQVHPVSSASPVTSGTTDPPARLPPSFA